MEKSSQNRAVDAPVRVIPGRVSVAMAEIAENVREGLLALAVGAGRRRVRGLAIASC